MTMDVSTRRRLFLGFIVNWIGKAASVIIQLIQVPVFLHFWNITALRRVAYRQLHPHLSQLLQHRLRQCRRQRDDHDGRPQRPRRRPPRLPELLVAHRLICSTVIILLSGALYFLPAAHLLKLTYISESDTKWIIFYLGVSVLLGQLEQLLQSAYRSIGRYPYGSMLKSIFSLIAFGCIIFPLSLGGGPRTAALVFAAINIFGTVSFCFLVQHDIPWIQFGWNHASSPRYASSCRPAIAFMAFPIGNALNLGGTLLAVGYALGPVDVVIFRTARTVSRVALQMVQMINGTFEPEMTIAFGARNIRPHPHPAPPSLPTRPHRRGIVVTRHDDSSAPGSSPIGQPTFPPAAASSASFFSS